jgi:DNA-binding MarR family transcriptional regulator
VPVPASLEANILFLCGEVTHLLHRGITASFRKNRLQLTVEQFSVLALLFYEDGINQQEISARLNRDKTTIARVISNMERNKTITRATDKSDSRGKLIFLTAKGRSLQRRAIGHAGMLYVKAINSTGKTDIAGSVKVLNRIIRNLNENI